MAMQKWFGDAKLGIFVHWGIYAVDGVAESWSFYTGQVSYEQYMDQLHRFTASRYEPRAWAELFARAGAGYAVLTAKHHDGVALFDTEHSGLSVAARTPAGRDLVAGYAQALREQGLKVGLYFSHSDWSHPDYATVRHPAPENVSLNDSRFSAPPPGQEDPERWERFLEYRAAQVREVAERFRPDLLWFDGEWERSEEQWRMDELAQEIVSLLPDTVLNARLLGHGDYATPEQGLPTEAPDGPWELCLTVNDSWGYQQADTNQKSVGQLIRYFTETIGMGGNLLLAVGPQEDGTIPQEQADRLLGLGAWIARHTEAVHGTVAGLPAGHHYGPSTVSADGRTLYLICFGTPHETVSVRGLNTPVKRVSVLATGDVLAHRVTGGLGHVPGVLWIDAPAGGQVDPHATVLVVELDGELELYRGKGRG